MNARETAWRVFATELNSSTLEIKATEEKAPSYIVTPLGAKINRVLVAGVMTEKENIGSDEEPMWKARIQDVSGSFYINVGRFQPEASAAIADIEIPSFVAAVGRVRTYTTDDQRVFVSVRPEHIVPITETVRNEWILETAKSTWKRLTATKKVLGMGDATEQDLIKAGMSPTEAFGITYALDNYGQMPDSTLYLKTIQAALRMLLLERNVDLGFPEDYSDEPDEIEIPEGQNGGTGNNAAQLEDMILSLLEELDTDGKGAPREELERRAEAEGISSIELEEVSNTLMDKGLVYEPNLRYLKRI
ncbi:MAG: glycerol dehydrogenase [Candidatus Methanomethylophilaceae archaeon]|nr:glycerol dehydrogenase [Candidatus Methanomethylophilaceae archaeon]MBR6911719.1 glycerol dehydrogenase [Candidatus Methanomethylophilaceae archaeon]